MKAFKKASSRDDMNHFVQKLTGVPEAAQETLANIVMPTLSCLAGGGGGDTTWGVEKMQLGTLINAAWNVEECSSEP